VIGPELPVDLALINDLIRGGTKPARRSRCGGWSVAHPRPWVNRGLYQSDLNLTVNASAGTGPDIIDLQGLDAGFNANATVNAEQRSAAPPHVDLCMCWKAASPMKQS
jgi:hypothetical protein